MGRTINNAPVAHSWRIGSYNGRLEDDDSSRREFRRLGVNAPSGKMGRRRIPSRREWRRGGMGDHRSRPIVDVDWIANYWRSLTLSRRQLRDTHKKEERSRAHVCRQVLSLLSSSVWSVIKKESQRQRQRQQQPLVLSRVNSQTELDIFTLSQLYKGSSCLYKQRETDTASSGLLYYQTPRTYPFSVPRCSSLVCLWPVKLLAPNSLSLSLTLFSLNHMHTHIYTHI